MADNQDTPTLPNQSGKEIGASGTIIFNGIISGEEYNRDLTGRSAIDIYDIMRRSDPTIRAVLQLVKQPLMAATYDMQQAEDDEEGEFKSDFIHNQLFEAINFDDLKRQAFTMFEFGYSLFEIVYQMVEFQGRTLIGIKKIAFRKQTSVKYWQTSDGKPGIQQYIYSQIPGQTIENQTPSIPMEKLVVFTLEKEGDNYEGTSLLRYAYKDWDIKDKLTIVNAIALERQAIGIPVLKKTGTVDGAEWKNAQKGLRNLRANEEAFAEVGENMDLTMLDMKAQTTAQVIPTLNYHDKNIYSSVLAKFMDLGGSSGSGAKGLSQDLTSLFMKAEGAAANIFVGAMMEQVVKRLCDLNFSDMSKGYPTLTVSNISDSDVAAMSTAVSSLVTAGALTPDADMENHIRDTLDLPELPSEVYDAYSEKGGLNGRPNGTPAVAPPAVEPKKPDVAEVDTKDIEASLKAARTYRTHLIGMLAEG